MEKLDLLIVGSGIAGLFFAAKTAKNNPDLSIVIMTKKRAKDANTYFAQGGIAVVTDLVEDSFEQHIKDTLKSGGGSCDEKIVNMVVRQAPERIQELIALGASFDLNDNGKWDLGLEGGHSQSRIMHHKDISGLEIETKLLQSISQLPNIVLLENHFLVDITTEEVEGKKQCSGAFYIDETSGTVKYVRAKAIVLSTGGSGQVFQNTTNPEVATGDGVAIANRAGAVIEDMQHIQFHPTALYEKDKNPFFLISEAVRGFGAHIINEAGKRFVFKSDVRGELATRDVVSAAIAKEMQHSEKNHVYLDCRHLDSVEFYKHFPSITDHCASIGLDLKKDLIPIVPVAHYQCGGIKVDENAETNIKNLFAIGECAKTGLHGKNRLASNSLLEALVFAHQASEAVNQRIASIAFVPRFFIPKVKELCANVDRDALKSLKKELQENMSKIFFNRELSGYDLIEDFKKLKRRAEQLAEKQRLSSELVEITNLFTVASIIIDHTVEELISSF